MNGIVYWCFRGSNGFFSLCSIFSDWCQTCCENAVHISFVVDVFNLAVFLSVYVHILFVSSMLGFCHHHLAHSFSPLFSLVFLYFYYFVLFFLIDVLPSFGIEC